MTLADVDHVVQLDHRAYDRDAWPARAFRHEIADSPISLFYLLQQTDSPDHRRHDQPLGYFGCWHVLDQLYLATIAVDPDHQGHGLGDLLCRTVLALAARLDCAELTLEVRQSNRPAIALYDKHGFQPSGRRRNLYANPREDGLHMTRLAPFPHISDMPRRAAQRFPGGLQITWRDRADDDDIHWPARPDPAIH